MSHLATFLDELNEALAWEIAGTIQYLQYSSMLTGTDRHPYAGQFHEGSEEARGHAEQVANKIASFGGIPTVEPAQVVQATDLAAMIEATLQLEEAALAAYERAHATGSALDEVNRGTVFWLEEMIAHEQEHVDEMRKLAGKIRFRASGSGGAQASA